jgi:kynurenine 3-monooxygenase
MDKRAIHLVDKLNKLRSGRRVFIYSISRGILNRKMIDLAEDAGAQFFFEQKIWDVSLACNFAYCVRQRGTWEDKNMMWCLVLMVLFKFVIECNIKKHV